MKSLILKGWLCASLCTAVGLSGCSDEKLPVAAEHQLTVEAVLEGSDLTKAVKTAWSDNDKIGLFVKQSSNISSADYGDVNGQVVTYFNGTAWNLSPAVSLSATPAYVYGYYPYSNTESDGGAINVSLASQTDYLYSGTAQQASSSNATVALTMKHALTLLSFNIKKSGYIGTGNLTSVVVRNKSGMQKWVSQGTLDISSGTITASAYDAFTLNCNKTIEAAGWTTDLPYIMAFPFSTGAASEVEVEFMVDGKSYVIALPNSVSFQAGSKYILTLTINSGSMVMDSNNMVIQPWGADQVVDLGGVQGL